MCIRDRRRLHSQGSYPAYTLGPEGGQQCRRRLLWSGRVGELLRDGEQVDSPYGPDKGRISDCFRLLQRFPRSWTRLPRGSGMAPRTRGRPSRWAQVGIVVRRPCVRAHLVADLSSEGSTIPASRKRSQIRSDTSEGLPGSESKRHYLLLPSSHPGNPRSLSEYFYPLSGRWRSSGNRHLGLG